MIWRVYTIDAYIVNYGVSLTMSYPIRIAPGRDVECVSPTSLFRLRICGLFTATCHGNGHGNWKVYIMQCININITHNEIVMENFSY